MRKVGTHAEDARLDLGVDKLVAAVCPVGHQVEDPEGRLQGHNHEKECAENQLDLYKPLHDMTDHLLRPAKCRGVLQGPRTSNENSMMSPVVA